MPSRAAALADWAAVLADRTRAHMCLALLDGRAWTAGELARSTGVAPSTATAHLDRLRTAGLITDRKQGRHRYVELAGPTIAQLLETLLAELDPTPTPPKTLRATTADAALARGRTCYNHLAGRLGVTITDAMTIRALLDPDNAHSLTPAGTTWLTTTLGIDEPTLTRSRRPLTRPCLDWTERRTHLGGPAAVLLHRRLLTLGWIIPSGTGRAVRATPTGEAGLAETLGIDPSDLR
ncbi:ArsR/SmtB family transcription factor [Nocardia sp. NPDC057663]|uniref:ArsR/SmtB family transcription factor n=1 Tax=Nocardia sp. NPDC057663 TaxID=3346201 RepID=UPI003671A58F